MMGLPMALRLRPAIHTHHENRNDRIFASRALPAAVDRSRTAEQSRRVEVVIANPPVMSLSSH
jgi:hypothetical protein